MTTITTTMTDLKARLQRFLVATAAQLEDFLARATKARLTPVQILEEILRIEEIDKTRRSVASRLRRARIGRFKPITDFDWNWPKKIERDVVERALELEFVREGRNLILLGSNGLGKTMIAKNVAYQAVMSGFSVLFTTAAELIEDLRSCSPETLRRRLARYTRPLLLCIDLCGVPGYVEFEPQAA
jgi:DNA replication protein DnaC